MSEKIRFRSPTEKPVRVASTNSQVAIVGPEWRELPDCLHALAVQAGCVSDYLPAASVSVENAPGREVGPEARIRQVLREMHNNPQPGDFAASTGLPNLNKVSKVLGFGVVRNDVLRVWQEITAEQANAA